MQNVWMYKVPVAVPKNTTFRITLKLTQRAKTYLKDATNAPGFQNQTYLDAGGVAVNRAKPNVFRVRAFTVGPRFLQLRGARTAE